ncbi:MAG TPA: GAF domain-containing sensor histidine kinase [Rubrobacteraceae bacterium]|nr:GAF domain-containing sensor histidine kinase [Rubrobacteraceae bacterium]
MHPEAKRTRQQGSEATPVKSGEEARRLAELDYLGAARPDPDHVLQEIVDELRLTFQTDLCMVNLDLSDVQYFRAWSGKLPEELALTRQDPQKRSMCKYVVGTVKPLCIPDFLATEEFKEQYFYVNYGIRFYAGTPLITSNGHTIGTLCLLGTSSRDDFGEEQMRLLRAFARAVVGRLELLGALERERDARTEAETTRERLKAILDNLTEGVLVADPRGYAVFANPAARAMLGVPSEGILEELPDPWEDFHLPDAVARCARNSESIEARVSYGESHLRVKLEYIGDDDRSGVLVVMRDLSEGHRLELNQQRFLSNAAHQLRTPTMALMGAAELLATGEDANPATRRRLLDHIFSEGRRLQRLADVLLRLSRVGWDLREPNQEVVDLREAGQQAAGLIEPLAESGGLRLSIGGEGTWVSADPEWLQEVLLALLSNAVKHSSRGGDIRVRLKGSAITVEDEGAGVSPVDLPHVFERFYRGKDNSGGFGLGLPICKELTERMGGSISIRSREGVGTEVKVELPEADPADARGTDRRE